MNQERIPFENRMSRTQTALGWIYFPLHVLVLPMLLGIFAAFAPYEISEVAVNLAYVGIGCAVLLIVMFRFYRRSFDAFCDRPGFCVLTMLWALIGTYAMSVGVSMILMLLGDLADNPNDAQILGLAEGSPGVMWAIAVYLAPIVEETLFRGVVFGSIRPHSRFWAYAVSVALFSLDHVWQYAAAWSDPWQLVYAIQYVPVSLALAWCYDRTGSIWTPVFFHMGFNALSLAVLNQL